MNDLFRRFSHRVSLAAGSSWAFILAISVVIIWAISGPIFHFSETWQLIINTGTTIVTFLMVFLVQNAQNRDAKAIHLKLDELIYGSKGARDKIIDAEDLSDEELQSLKDKLEKTLHTRKSKSK